MIDTVITVLLIVLLLPAVLLFVLIVSMALAPSFDEFDQINECIGCPEGGKEHPRCRGCEYNPEYRDGLDYIGPNRKEMKKIRKELNL